MKQIVVGGKAVLIVDHSEMGFPEGSEVFVRSADLSSGLCYVKPYGKSDLVPHSVVGVTDLKSVFPVFKSAPNLENVIPAKMAREMAETQHDLGTVSKDNMVCCLSFSDPDIKAISFDQLDPISQLIVMMTLGNESREELISELNYTISNLKALRDRLESMEDELYTF